MMCHDPDWAPDDDLLAEVVDLMQSAYHAGKSAEVPPDLRGACDMFAQSFKANVFTPPCALPSRLVGRSDVYLVCGSLLRVYLADGHLSPTAAFPVLMIPTPRFEEWTANSIPFWYWNATAYATEQRVKHPPGMGGEPLGHRALSPGRHVRGGITWQPFDPQPPSETTA